MRRNFYILLLMMVALLSAANVVAADDDNVFWKCVYYNDFGGNSKTADLIGPELAPGETHESLDWDPTLQWGYVLTKHWDSNSEWYNGGDHTFKDDRETGYFLIINPDNRNDEIVAYKTRLDGLCRGVHFRFKAYVANMTKASSSTAGFQPTIGVGVYEGEKPEVKVSEQAYYKRQLRQFLDMVQWCSG